VRTAYFDAFSGVSGDMVIGALIDAGLGITHLRRELRKLPLTGYTIAARKVSRNSIGATSFSVKVTKKQKSRNYSAIKRIIEKSELGGDVKKMSLAIFHRIATAEAEVHGRPIEEVHFHEVGGVDSIVDVVGAAIGFYKLGVQRFECSPLPVGSGFIKSSHGVMPLPAPATLLLLKGVPIKSGGIGMELVTPTGAGIVTALCGRFGEMPLMKPESVGYGAGSVTRKDGVPNLLRIVVGKTVGTAKKLLVLETNIDDGSPEQISHAVSVLMAGGALDAWVTPITMKKGRQAWTLSALCDAVKADGLRDIILEETPALGLRRYEVDRFELPRKIVKVKTEYGTVRVKIAVTPSGEKRFKPEFDDVSKLARKHGIPFRKIYKQAEVLARTANED